MGKLTNKHIEAMHGAVNGCDVFSLPLARLLREVEKIAPEMIDICDPQGIYDGISKVPYFGVIITRKGNRFLNK